MIPLASLVRKPILPLLVLTHLVGCSTEDVTGPKSPDIQPPVPVTGQIVVSVTADRSGLELSFAIDGVGSWPVGPNDDVRVSGLTPGQYRVNLTVPATARQDEPGCQVRDGSQRMAIVRAGETTAVQYYLACDTAPARPRERNVR